RHADVSMYRGTLRKLIPRIPYAIGCGTLFAFSVLAIATSVNAEVTVEGNATAARIIAKQAPVTDFLKSLRRTLTVRYDNLVSLDGVVNGTYSGSLEQVLPRMLMGFNYVIIRRDDAFELIVVGRPAATPVATEAAQTTLPANTNPAAQWRSSSTSLKKQ